jgi:predicted transcriptional regulator
MPTKTTPRPEPKNTVQVRFTREQIEALDRLAKKTEIPRSWHVRRAVAEFLVANGELKEARA